MSYQDNLMVTKMWLQNERKERPQYQYAGMVEFLPTLDLLVEGGIPKYSRA